MTLEIKNTVQDNESPPEGGWYVDLSDKFKAPADRAYDVKIVGIGEKPANQFMANPMNWRKHPEEQREAMKEILGAFGFVTGVVENVRTGNLLDGHERLWEALQNGEETLVPFIQIDISEDDENDLLLVYDKVGEMIYPDHEILAGLLENSKLQTNEHLGGMLNNMKALYSLDPPVDFDDIKDDDIPTDKEPPTLVCPNCGHTYHE